MALSSMTGFARGHGTCGPYAWAWEIKSVNGKGLDLRLRLPPGWDAIEAPVRARAAESLARGSVQANLTVERSGALPVVRVNTAVLEAVLATAQALAPRIEAAPPSLDGLLALKGVIEVGEAEEREEERRAAEAAAIEGFAEVHRRAHRDARPRRRGARTGAWRRGLAKLPRWRSAPSSRPAGARGDPDTARRAGRDAPVAVRALRCGPAASGSDPDRGQGRRARGA